MVEKEGGATMVLLTVVVCVIAPAEDAVIVPEIPPPYPAERRTYRVELTVPLPLVVRLSEDA
jgi:hypothetical protein